MDLVTDLPPSLGPDGLSYDSICTFVCLLTKQAFFVRCNKTITANGLAHLFIDNVYRLKGLPTKNISDRDTRITSDFWQTLFSQLGSHLNISNASHPQTDGQSERTHRTIEQILRAYVHPHHDDWATWLPVAEFAYNNSPHSTTTVSPFMANYGYGPHTPLSLSLPSDPVNHARNIRDVHQLIITLSQQAKVFQEHYANAHRRPLSFNVGDLVRLTTDHITLPTQPSSKLVDRYLGPFKVLQVVSPVAYRLQLPPSMHLIHPVFHVSRLLPFISNDDAEFPHRPLPTRPSPVAHDESNPRAWYYVDHIISGRVNMQEPRYPKL